ncbi:surface anchored protein [Streptococcus pseudopneumoniae]|uniref:DUF1542 domain-containing protein n=1 Tax=Streptococcus pseudopneumoniae TaxID=257758 RepID=UPI0005DE5A21|nr:DUF1542 domain-containing protein [Streptococcus pseudopneumoniae]CJY92400.1 surface anchored protein [Streptococcus pseudopneumoniae]COC90481.1 surface anchored protein [Streptococcus pseudopneumoniae]CON95620.1 surface anchored protein [Streptococcus pseudopneumoniae]
MFKKKNDGNGEKIFRYSIRKYHFGAASVAVAALMFFANGVQAQAPAVSSATASDVVAESAGTPDKDKQESDGEEPEKVSQTEPSAELQSTGESNSPETKTEDASKGQETADLAPTKPEAKPAAQETSQSEREKEQGQPTSVTKTTEAKSLQGNLQALLEKLTLSSMKALHDKVESRLAAAKAVLDDPNATQVQVDEQVRLMEDLIRRVNQVLEPSQPKLTDLGEAGSTNNKLVEPNGTATEQATGGKRRKREGVTEPGTVANQVNPTDGGKETAPGDNSQSTPRELPTYTNTTEGENGVYGLKKELEDITKELRRYGASEDKIQAAKAAADKFNEAFSKGDTISQEDFAAALVDLKKSRDLIEGVLEEKYGEETTAGGVTPQPRDGGYSDFRSANYSGRSARVARASENYSQDFLTARESYFERTDIKGHSPYDKYTYVFFSDRRPRNNATAFVKDGYKYLNVTVKPTNKGFLWKIEINKDNHRTFPGHTEVWFTVPSGQTVKTNTVGISYYDRGGGGHAPAQDGRDLVEKLKRANIGLGDVKKGTISNSGLSRRIGPTSFPRRNLEDLATGRRYNANPYEKQAESREAQAISNEKLNNIKRDVNASLYYFQLPNSDRSYMLTFETEGNTDLGRLDYAAGLRGQDGHEVFLVNQWHSRTTTEFKEDAFKQIEQARRDKNSSITGNKSLSEVEKNGATSKVNIYARRATSGINQAQNIGDVENSLQQGLSDIQNVNPVGKENALKAVDEAKKAKDQAITTNQSLSDTEKTEAKEAVKTAADQAKTKINNAGDQSTVDQAKNDGLTALDKILKDLSDRINQGNSFTPSNGGNQAGSDSRGDTASQGDRPAPSDDGSQSDANNQDQSTTPSAPAHSGDSTDQATAQSTQQRGTGNATAPESPQGLSESSVTPPTRNRRSVTFAGGTQSSQEKQVDKSVLRDLIGDLETRLKDLDGIDQSVIDAVKVILGEGQEALRNADLTEAGLKEMTAKVKEALESLKGKQTTKDEETKETRKEQGHLPYGTMIASLLALLGLLLFLIARRKKESELKKLTKELTKVLQESDLTSVDAKVLDQAREALAQAVAFLANEKESDHTEDELIEKLKAILAQLR